MPELYLRKLVLTVYLYVVCIIDKYVICKIKIHFVLNCQYKYKSYNFNMYLLTGIKNG